MRIIKYGLLILLSLSFISNTAECQSGWNELGTGANALQANNTIAAITKDAAGNIYATGGFTNADGKYYVAKWDGSTWQQLGNLNPAFTISTISAIVSDKSGNIYVAGGFRNPAGKYYVAKWDGSTWQELGNLNANSDIFTLAIDNAGNIYTAGGFSNLSGYRYVAKWDGSTWQELGTGSAALNANFYINTITTDKFGNVYAAGLFTNGANNQSGNYYVAKWNGNSWQEVGSLKPSNSFNSIIIDSSNNLLAAGRFSKNGKYYVAKWDGSTWQELGSGTNVLNANNWLYSLAVDRENNVYAAGSFTNASGKRYVAKWNGTVWIELGASDIPLNANATIYSLVCDSLGAIYAAGYFTNLSGKYYVAKYNKIQPPNILYFTPTFGGNGATIKIGGTNFSGATAVSIGGVPATSFVVISDSVINAVPGAGTSGVVLVTTPLGTNTLAGFVYRPVISSFSPASAKSGTAVTITGSGFDLTPANNIVYFGAVRATVMSAAATSIIVTVPAGAKYSPITVTVNGLTAYSLNPFLLTFAGGPLTPKSFIQKASFAYHPGADNFVLQDFDNDGKPDIVSADDSLVVSRNVSLPGNILFGENKSFGLIGHYTIKVGVGDFNGDGRPDIATGSEFSFPNYYLSIFQNTSVTGNISFTRINIPADDFLTHVAINDVDGDGKPDIIITGLYKDYLNVYRNTTINGIISFAAPVKYVMPNNSSYEIILADMDNDGKEDLVTDSGPGDQILLYRNTSTPGSISFANFIAFSAPGYLTNISVSDLDADGKQDIVIQIGDIKQFSIFRNASTPGNFSFPSRYNVDHNTWTGEFTINDADGDGKPDIVFADGGISNSVSIYRNISTPGNIAFADNIDNVSEFNMNNIDIGDMDGDGKPDIELLNPTTFSFLRNCIGEPIINSLSPLQGNAGTTVTIKGYSFTGINAISFGGVNISSFSVISDSVITAMMPTKFAGGDVVVSSPAGTGTLVDQFPVPVINSISPASGNIGTVVTIKGANFNSINQNNIVYFGAVRATVISSTDSSVQVIVPKGTTFKPITLTTHNLTAYSTSPFIVTFTGGDTTFNALSFEHQFLDTIAARLVIQDLDNDGSPDIAVSNSVHSQYVRILKNNGDTGHVSFAKITSDPYLAGTLSVDLDGDGKCDLYAPTFNSSSDGVTICRNKSDVSNISFEQAVYIYNIFRRYNSNLYSTFLTSSPAADLNKDGKPDIVINENYSLDGVNYSGDIGVLKNNSIKNIISLSGDQYFSVGSKAGPIRICDLDKDGLPDILTLKSNTTDSGFSVLRNTYTGNNFSFAAYKDFKSGTYSTDFETGDLDGDGKDDVIMPDENSTRISIFVNTSSQGAISFAPKIAIQAGKKTRHITVGDLNGDGKPEMVVINDDAAVISVFKNTSSIGNISFSPPAFYECSSAKSENRLPTNYNLAICDVDKDGYPDIVFIEDAKDIISVLRNKQGEASVKQLCDTIDNTSFKADMVGANYQWQLSTDSVNFNNINNNSNYIGTNSNTLNLVNIPSSWYGYQYRCVVDGKNNRRFKLQFLNTWTGAINAAWENPANWSCGVLPDMNTDVIINSGTVVLSSNTVVRSLRVNPNASLTVSPGSTLRITH